MATSEAVHMSTNKLDQIIKAMDSLEDLEVVVGYQGEKAQQFALKYDADGGKVPQPINMATLAAIHNFGTSDGHIPARPYMSIGLMNSREEVQKRMALIAKRIHDGDTTPKKDLNAIGAVVVNAMRQALESLKNDARYALSEATKENRKRRRGARKGDNASPLIDTGRLRQSLSFAVRKIRGGL